ncbi:MAG: ABC transporter ATP-binding protein [Candidatus Bathyarchaeota archaeon]|nr:ABC transporter ATP-binding protein [Candidatus Bathyarchaeota archaeon]
MQNEYAIQTINLTKTFKTKTPNTSLFNRKTQSLNAIDNLNLNIKKGELFGLLGPNGAGKTTLVKILCTLLPPDQGTATLNGYDIIKQQMQVKQSLGTLFSVGERGFFWRLSGYRNLEFFAAIYNVPRRKRQERILGVLNLVGLENSTYDLYQKYSGGMKRKLALARTLLPDPPILLLDEPTTNLDAASSRNIREFIQNTVKETGKTVLYTTHHIEEAAQICTKIGILNRGKLIAQDTPNALRDKIKKEEQIFLIVEGIKPQQIENLRSLQGVITITENSEELLPNQKGLCLELKNVDQLPLVFDFLFERKIKLVNFKREEPTLEDAFIELTRRA